MWIIEAEKGRGEQSEQGVMPEEPRYLADTTEWQTWESGQTHTMPRGRGEMEVKCGEAAS